MVGTTGIEPVTLCMSSIHSNQLSYAPTLFIISLLLRNYNMAMRTIINAVDNIIYRIMT